MDVHWMLSCLSVILSLCLSCNCSDEEAESSGDQTDHLKHLWQLIKEAKMRENGAVQHFHPARGAKTHQLLYCRVGIGYHLQILTNGSVGGVHDPSEYSLLRVFSMRPGVVGIRGVKNELYLCMNEEGIARGMKQFTDECLFKEHMEENHFNTYSSLPYSGLYLALSQHGQLKKGNRVGRNQASTHFLPRKPPLH